MELSHLPAYKECVYIYIKNVVNFQNVLGLWEWFQQCDHRSIHEAKLSSVKSPWHYWCHHYNIFGVICSCIDQRQWRNICIYHCVVCCRARTPQCAVTVIGDEQRPAHLPPGTSRLRGTDCIVREAVSDWAGAWFTFQNVRPFPASWVMQINPDCRNVPTSSSSILKLSVSSIQKWIEQQSAHSGSDFHIFIFRQTCVRK